MERVPNVWVIIRGGSSRISPPITAFNMGPFSFSSTPTLPIKSDNSDDTTFSENESPPHFSSIAVFIALMWGCLWSFKGTFAAQSFRGEIVDLDLSADHHLRYGTCLLFFTPTLPISSENSNSTLTDRPQPPEIFSSIPVFIAYLWDWLQSLRVALCADNFMVKSPILYADHHL